MRLDLHIHTNSYSACSTMTPDQMAASAKAAGLDGICITEHNRIWDRQEASSLGRKHDLPIFRGMEVTTTGGDILVFGMEEETHRDVDPGRLEGQGGRGRRGGHRGSPVPRFFAFRVWRIEDEFG